MQLRHAFAVVLIAAALPLSAADSTSAGYSAALHRALLRTNATALVLDVATGRVLAAEHPDRAAALAASPGSVLKPFYLQTALDSGIIQPLTAVHCNRILHIAGHTLNCGHPADPASLTARQALAYSCNTYFAALGLHLTTTQFQSTLHRYGLDAPSHLFRNESIAPIRLPRTADERQLFTLGITGIRVTPAQVAAAYQRLALAHLNHADSPATAAVWQGLEDSVLYGTSDSASLPWMITAGKTGTAADQDFSRTHGWFVGIAPSASPRIIIVIFLPSGTGGDASLLAHRFYLAAQPLLTGASPK